MCASCENNFVLSVSTYLLLPEARFFFWPKALLMLSREAHICFHEMHNRASTKNKKARLVLLQVAHHVLSEKCKNRKKEKHVPSFKKTQPFGLNFFFLFWHRFCFFSVLFFVRFSVVFVFFQVFIFFLVSIFS